MENYKQNALNIVDQFIGIHTAKAKYEELSVKAVEVLRELREIVELHWGE